MLIENPSNELVSVFTSLGYRPCEYAGGRLITSTATATNQYSCHWGEPAGTPLSAFGGVASLPSVRSVAGCRLHAKCRGNEVQMVETEGETKRFLATSSRRFRAVNALLSAAATLLVSLGPAGPAAASSGALGIYGGGGAVAATTAFAGWLGSPVNRAVDYVDQEAGWEGIAQPLWLLDTWGPWVRGGSDRRLVLAVPMLPSSAWGQLRVGAAGYFDAPFLALARNMVDRGLGTSVIRLGWEANTWAHPWAAEGDPASYRQFFRRIVSVMRSVPGAGFSFDWTANSGVGGGSVLTAFDSFYPGDDVVDLIGLDVYDMKWDDSTSTPAERWDFTLHQRLGLADHRAFAQAHGKSVTFPEWAMRAKGDQFGGGGDSPYYVDRMADWFATTSPAYQAYFDVDWGGGVMASFPEGQARYRARFGAIAPNAGLSVSGRAT